MKKVMSRGFRASVQKAKERSKLLTVRMTWSILASQRKEAEGGKGVTFPFCRVKGEEGSTNFILL